MNELERAARQALEALQKIYIAPEHDEYIRVWWPACEDATTALRQALEKQPSDEPVAWRYNGKLHEFDPSDWATSPVTPLYTSPPAKPWVNPSLKEYEDIMLANITPSTEDERDGIMCALNDMVVLLKEKNQ